MNGPTPELNRSIRSQSEQIRAPARPGTVKTIPDMCTGCRLESYASKESRANQRHLEGRDCSSFVWLQPMAIRSRFLQGYCAACKGLAPLTGLRLSDVLLIASFGFFSFSLVLWA